MRVSIKKASASSRRELPAQHKLLCYRPPTLAVACRQLSGANRYRQFFGSGNLKAFLCLYI